MSTGESAKYQWIAGFCFSCFTRKGSQIRVLSSPPEKDIRQDVLFALIFTARRTAPLSAFSCWGRRGPQRPGHASSWFIETLQYLNCIEFSERWHPDECPFLFFCCPRRRSTTRGGGRCGPPPASHTCLSPTSAPTSGTPPSFANTMPMTPPQICPTNTGTSRLG